MTKKHKDLQPWLDYFAMLHTYEQKGYLEVLPDKHEAYVTLPALLTLNPTPALPEGEGDAVADGKALQDTMTRIRAYAAYRAANQRGLQDFNPEIFTNPNLDLPSIPEKELTAYLSQNFALHVVKPDPPHDVLLTFLLTLKRNRIGRKMEHIETISYVDEVKSE